MTLISMAPLEFEKCDFLLPARLNLLQKLKCALVVIVGQPRGWVGGSTILANWANYHGPQIIALCPGFQQKCFNNYEIGAI